MYRVAANVLAMAHAAFMAAVALGFLLPFWLQFLLTVTLTFAAWRGRGRCPWTLMEYRWRRRGGYRGPVVGLTRRLLLLRVSERAASRVAYGVAALSFAIGLLQWWRG